MWKRHRQKKIFFFYPKKDEIQILGKKNRKNEIHKYERISTGRPSYENLCERFFDCHLHKHTPCVIKTILLDETNKPFRQKKKPNQQNTQKKKCERKCSTSSKRKKKRERKKKRFFIGAYTFDFQINFTLKS